MHTHSTFSRLAIVLVALALGALVLACGSGSPATPAEIAEVATAAPSNATAPTAEAASTAAPAVEQAAPTAAPAAATAPAGLQRYKVGDVISINDLVMVVLGWDTPKGDQFSKPETGKQFVAVDLLLVNKGTSATSISSLAQMTLKDASDQKYTLDLLAASAAGASSPEGELAPGERVRGKVGFQVPEGAQGLTFVFDASLFGQGRLFIDLGDKPTQLDPPAELAGEQAQTTYKVGDVIKIGDLSLTINSVATPKGNQFSKPRAGQHFVVVDLTIANLGTKEATISALLQMALKDASGQKYDVDLMATTAAKGALPDGKLAAGEKLRGQVGYQVPSAAKGLVFVFDADVFGAGKIFVTLPE